MSDRDGDPSRGRRSTDETAASQRRGLVVLVAWLTVTATITPFVAVPAGGAAATTNGTTVSGSAAVVGTCTQLGNLGNEIIEDGVVIDSSGCYVVTQDIDGESGDPLIEITASDVVVRGGGNELSRGSAQTTPSGQFFDNRVGIYVTGSVSNVTVSNLTVSGYDTGVYADDTTGVTLDGVAVAASPSVNATGVRLTASTDAVVENTTLDSVRLLVEDGSDDTLVQNVTVTDTEARAVTVSDTQNVTLQNATVAGVDATAAVLSRRSANVTISNTTVTPTTGAVPPELLVYVDDSDGRLKSVTPRTEAVTDYGVTDAAVIGPPAFLDGDDAVEVPYVDNDGNLEVVDASGQTTTFVGANDLGTSPRTGKSKLAVTDWDGDGNPDVVFANGNGVLYRVDSDETGGPKSISTDKDVQFVVGAFDVTGDNERDVVYITTSSGLRAVDGETGTDTELSTDTTWGADDQIGFGEPTLRNGTFVSPRVSGGEEPQLQLFDGEGTVEQISDFDVAKTAPTAVDLDGDGRAAYAFVTEDGNLVTTRPNDSFRTVTVGETEIEVDDDVGLASPVTVRTPAVVSVRDTGNLTVENLTVGNAGTTSPSGEPPGDVANLSFTARNVSVAAAATLPLDPDGAANLTDSGLDVRNTTGGDPVFEARFAYTQADVTETGFDESTGGVGQYDGDTDTWVFLDSTQQAIDDEIGVTVPHNRRGVVAPFVGATEPDETGPTVSVTVVDEVGSAATVNVTSDEPLAALEVNVDGPGPLEAREREAFEEVRLPNGEYSYRTPLSFPAGAVTVELTTATDAAGNAAGTVPNETATVTAMATVDDSGGADFTSIQTAVEQTPPGSVIAVANGTYEESVTVAQNTTLSLASSAVLSGATTAESVGIEVVGDANLTVDGGTVREFAVGVAGNGTTGNVTLRNLTVRDTASHAVNASQSDGNWTVTNVTLRATATGITAVASTGDWTIRDTVVDDVTTTAVNATAAAGTWSVNGSALLGYGSVGLNATDATQTVDATDNLWGDGDAPTVSANGSATGDCVGNVDCASHLTSVPSDAGAAGADSVKLPDIVVDPANGVGDYDTIQEGLNNAADGDRVAVRPGTYDSSVDDEIDVFDNVTLAFDVGVTLENNDGGGPAAIILNEDSDPIAATIVGGTITGYEVGIDATGVDGNWTVRETTIEPGESGIAVDTADSTGNWTVENVVTDGGTHGIVTTGATGDWTVRETELRNHVESAVVTAESSGNWILRDTVVDSLGADGVNATDSTGNWTVESVNVTDASTDPVVNATASTGNWTVTALHTNDTETVVDATNATGDWLLRDTTVRNATAPVTAIGTNGSWTIENVTATDVLFAAVNASTSTGDWTVGNLTAENVTRGLDATNATGNWTVRDTRVTDAGTEQSTTEGVAIAADNATGAVTLDNLRIVDTQTDAIGADDSTGNWSLQNVSIEDVQNDGTAADDAAGNWTLQNVSVVGSGDGGIDADGAAGNWSLQNVSVVDGDDDGINTDDATGNWTLQNVSVNGTEGRGIYADDSTGNWTLQQVSVNDTGEEGIEGDDGNWTLQNVSVNDTGEEGIEGDDGNWTLQQVSVNDTGEEGIEGDDGNWTLQNVSVNDTGEQGIEGGDGNWTLQNVSVANTGDEGIEAGDGDWTLQNVSVADTDDEGLNAGSVDGDWTIRNTSVTDADGDGIDANGATGDWTVRDTAVVNVSAAAVDADSVSGSWSIHDSLFGDYDGVGVNATDATQTVDATDNFWLNGDDTDEPTVTANESATGDCVGNVDCDPFSITLPASAGAPAGVGVADGGEDEGGEESEITAPTVEPFAVAADGSGEYATIQAALDAAESGDRIVVRPGTYEGSPVVAKNVSLTFEPGAVLDPGAGEPPAAAVTITGGNEPTAATVEGLHVTGYPTAVEATGTTGNWTLRNATLRNATTGVVAAQSTGNWTVETTTVTNVTVDGLFVDSATGNWSVGNTTVTDTGDDGVDAENTSGDWSVFGLTVQNVSDVGIDTENGTGNWTIRNTTVENTTDTAVSTVNTTGNWTVENTTLRTVGGNGVYAANATGQWTLRNVTVDNTTSLPGIFVAATDSEWLIENTTVNATATDGITVVETDGDWTIRNTTVTSAGASGSSEPASGVNVTGGDGDWTLSNVTVDDAATAAVAVTVADGQWTIRNSSLSNASYGLRALGTVGDWTVENTTVRDTTQGGLIAFANGGDWTVEDVLLRDAGDVGIDASATAGDWTIRNATVDSNAGTGVDASNAVGDWLITNSEVTDNELDGIDAYAATGQWTINETEISGNSRTGLVARGSDTGTVERVYWGFPGSNPHGPGGRYEGGGNRIAGAVGTLGDVYQSSSMTEAVSPPASRTVGETITVGTGQQADTNSIQTALDRVPSGGTVETIVVAPRPESDYTEQIRVGVNVTIEAPGAVLDGPSGSDAAGEPAGVTIPHGANAAPTIEDLAVAGFTWGVLARFTDGNWTLQNVTVVGQSRGLVAARTTGDWRVVNATVTGLVAVDADSSTGEWVIENSSVTGGSTAVAADSTGGDWQIVNTSVTGQDTGLDATSSAGDWELLAVNVSDGETGVNAARASGNWLIRNSTVSAATTVAGNAPADAGTAVYAVETTGVWTVTETTLTDTARATVNATDAALRGDATNNWWGRQAGPRPDDCVGAVLCRDPLDRQPGGVQLSSVAVTPEVVAGNSVTVTATLTNDALASRTVDLELAVGSRSPKTETVTLTPGETKTVERTFQTDSLPAAPAQVTAQITRSGETVVLGVATNQTTVLDPAFVEIQSVTVPAAPPTGESTLSVGLRNTGEVNASQDVTLRVDTDQNGEVDTTVDTQSIQLTPGENRIVSTLVVDPSTLEIPPGSYDVLVETANDSVTRELTVLTPANLTVQSLTVPPAAGPSQQVTVQAVLRNDGGVTADQTVTVDVDPQDGQSTSTTRTETVSVSSGATETLTVQFDTSTLEGGSYNVSVTTDDAVTNDTLSVGNEAPELTVSAEGTLALGSFPAGEGTELNVTLTNTGGTPLNVTNATVVGNDTDAFTLSGPLVGGTPYNLTADESVDVTVNATTSVDDARALDTTLRIESEDPTSPITTIQTTANATGPVAGVNTGRLRYFSRSVDTTTNQTLLLDNRGNEPLIVEDISVSGQDASAFTVETVPRTVSGAQQVSPQDTGEITVSFTPGSGGDKRAKLTVETNDPDDGEINVTLTGAGKQPDAVTTPADTLRYGRVGTETTLTRNVTVENDGGAPLTVERVVANGSSAFSVVAGNGTGELVPGQTRTVTVAFDPAAAGELSGNLTVVSNDPDGNETVSLTGIGNVSNVSLGSEQVTFGNTGVGSSSLGSLTLSNTGNETLVIQRATVTGGDTDAFAVVTADGIRVPPDTSQTVSVAFAPDSTGTRSATLTLETNDPDEPSVTVSLDGTGAEADIVSEPASVAFGATPTGQTVTRNVTIRNDGGVSASLTSAVFTGTSAAAFSVTDGLGAGETTLGSGDTVTVTVEFAPTAQGERTGVLQVRNASNTVVTNVSVGGVGAVPDADPNTTSVNFSDTRVAGERTATVIVANDGNAQLNLTSVSVAGANDTAFAVRNAPSTVPSGARLPVTVAFTPESTGGKDANLTFETNDPAGVANVSVNGTANTVAANSTNNVSFASTGTERKVTVENDGDASANLTVDRELLVGPNPKAYSVTGVEGNVGFPFTLEPGESRNVTVELKSSASTTERRFARLRLFTTDPSQPQLDTFLSNTDTIIDVDTIQGNGTTGPGANVTIQNAPDDTTLPANVSTPETLRGDVGIQNLNVSVGETGNFSVNFTQANEPVEENAPNFSSPNGTNVDPVKYIRVNKTVSDDEIENATFKLRVSKVQIAESGTTPEGLSLYRFVNGSWTELNATLVGETNTHYVYSVETPGFSDFAAGAKKPKFDITSAEIPPGDVTVTAIRVGDTVDILVRISNEEGAADGTFTTKLLLDGDVIEERDVTIAAGGTRQIRFVRQFTSPGNFSVLVNDVSAGSVDVSDPSDGGGGGGGGGNEQQNVPLEIASTSVGSQTVAPGEAVTLSVTVRNPDSDPKTFDASLQINGVELSDRLVSVPDGESQTVSYTRSFDREGTYDVSIGDAFVGTVEVTESADDDTTPADSETPQTPVDTPQTPADTPQTPGGTPQTPTDTPQTPAESTPSDSQTPAESTPSDSQTETADTPTDDQTETAGTPAETPPPTGTPTTPTPRSPTPTADVNLTVVNALLDSEQISPGEVLTVTAVVENTGETAGDARVALVVNGLTVATERVELAAGESARVTFDRRFENRGTFEIAVGDTTAGQVVVATPTPSVTETVGTTTDNSTSSSFPGFGPAAVVAALLAVALLVRRRGER